MTKFLLLLPALFLTACLEVPTDYIGIYKNETETLTITKHSITLSEGDVVIGSCDRGFRPSATYAAAMKGEAGLYVIPAIDFYLDGKYKPEIFEPEDNLGSSGDKYNINGKDPGCYGAQDGVEACVKWSKRYINLYCFTPGGPATVINDQYTQVHGTAFYLGIDLQVDHKLQRLMITKDRDFQLSAIKGDYKIHTPYTWVVGNSGINPDTLYRVK